MGELPLWGARRFSEDPTSQLHTCWEAGVGHVGVVGVRSGVPIIGSDMSRDIRLSDVSIETPDSDESESLAVCLSVPLG